MNRNSLLLCALLALSSVSAVAVEPDAGTRADPMRAAPQADASRWKAWGGEMQFRWNRDLMRDYGIEVSAPMQGGRPSKHGLETFAVRDATAIDFALRDGAFDGFRGGALSVRGGFDLKLADGTIVLRDFTLRPRAGDAFVLDVIAADGVAWFYIDRLMYEIDPDTASLAIKAMDLRIAPVLARRLGDERVAGHTAAGLRMTTRVHGDGFAAATTKGTTSKWHGDPAPVGAPQPGQFYQADVFMWSFTAQYSRKDAQANGPGGTDGLVVYTPSSTLRNSRSNGTATETVVGDPLGTSPAPYAANVPWYTKFTGNFAPHRNDQHPYLIWNLYRIDGDGRITQVGRSGVKHAWLTTNSSCDEHPGSSHILGRGCQDTYGVGNNDEITDLGPRSEIIPATGEWGRCNSVYDRRNDVAGTAVCDAVEDFNAPCSNYVGTQCTTYAYRMGVRESQIDPDPALNAGSTYLFESWYIVRDDVNIYNTMQTRPVSFLWNGSTWAINNGSAAGLRLGPAIDRWMPRGTSTLTERSTDINREEGEGRVAVKVTALSGGQYRYDYAVMNFDFAEAVTSGAEPNLTVLSNDGFTAFRVPLPPTADLTSIAFNDGDDDVGNDWSVAQQADAISWQAPAGNALNWGTMFRFSFIADAPPQTASVRLTTAQQSVPDVENVISIGPAGSNGSGFAVGGSVTGVNGSDGVDLALNGGTALTVASDGAFLFPTPLPDGATYAVTVVRAPLGRECLVTQGSGTIGGDDALDVMVECSPIPPEPETVGGVLSGLVAGRSVGLKLNGGATLTLSANGGFTFPTTVDVGSPYAVTVATQPVAQQCTLNAASGTVPPQGVSDVTVTCTELPTTMHSVQVTLAGLDAGANVVLRLNDANNLQLNANGSFVFGALLPNGGNYVVTVWRQPQGQRCSVVRGSGTIDGADVDDVGVDCVDLPPTYAVGGDVAGLESGQSVAVTLNATETAIIAANGAFAFVTGLEAGATYAVTSGQTSGGAQCQVTGGNGTMPAAAVSGVQVICTTPRYAIGGSVSGLLMGESVELRLNGGETLTVAANGGFAFNTRLMQGAPYQVEVVAASGGAQCTVAAGVGTTAAADVVLAVNCVAPMQMFSDGFEPR